MTRAQQTLSVLLLVSSVCRKLNIFTPQPHTEVHPNAPLTYFLALPLPLPRPGPLERDRPDRGHPRGKSRQRHLPSLPTAQTIETDPFFFSLLIV